MSSVWLVVVHGLKYMKREKIVRYQTPGILYKCRSRYWSWRTMFQFLWSKPWSCVEPTVKTFMAIPHNLPITSLRHMNYRCNTFMWSLWPATIEGSSDTVHWLTFIIILNAVSLSLNLSIGLAKPLHFTFLIQDRNQMKNKLIVVLVACFLCVTMSGCGAAKSSETLLESTNQQQRPWVNGQDSIASVPDIDMPVYLNLGH